MYIKAENGKVEIITTGKQERDSYNVVIGQNNKKAVALDSVTSVVLHVVDGNSKTGEQVVNFNFPIEFTCDHRCECYKKGICYAEGGCYTFPNNQASYSENLNFFMTHSDEEFLTALQLALDYYGFELWRYFTCGDILNNRFFRLMVEFAKRNPAVRFWSYTKKYEIVNRWIDENGDLPENLVIIFSHWMNEDGSYFEMNNRHNLPTSEFIPFGKEELAEKVTHICPCSDPTVKATCATCDHPCYKLQKGESMALLEHSTKATKERDKALKAAKEKL